MKSIQNSIELQDPFLKDLSEEINKLEKHQETASGFETAIRLEASLRERVFKRMLKDREELMLHRIQQRIISKVEQELFTFAGFQKVK